MPIFRLLILIVLTGCTASSPWQLDSIAGANSSFDSSRLIHQTHSHLVLELLRTASKTEAFVFLKQHRFNFDSPFVEITLMIDGEQVTESTPLRKGKMKLRLSEELTKLLILSLQEGKEVAILVGGFQEVIKPDRFDDKYRQFLKGQTIFSNIMKGPIE